MIPDEPALGIKGIAIALADGISSSDVSRIAERVGGQELPDGLLLHVGCLVGKDIGAARHLGATNSWLHAQTRRSPYRLRQGQRLCLHVERDGHQINHRAYLPCRRLAHLSRGPAMRSEQLTEDHRIVVSSEQSVSRPSAREPIPRSTSTTATFQLQTGRRLGHADRRRLRAPRWRFPSPDRSTINAHDLDRAARTIVEEAYKLRQPGQSHRPDRAGRRAAGRRRERGFGLDRRTAGCRHLLEARP